MNARDSQQAGRQTLLSVEKHLSPAPRVHYLDHPFHVPPGASRVGLRLTFHKRTLAQLFISLHDPHGFRGNRMNPGPRGDIELELWVAPDDASEGGLPGPLPGGQWLARLDVEALGEETDYRLEVYADHGVVQQAVAARYPEGHVARTEAGWYKGELHAHSTESDGQCPVEKVVQSAMEHGLDFLALAEHFTVSHWRKLAQLVNDQLALIRSCEITSHHGHANLHGIRQWVDVYVDRPGWDMNQAADAVHAQGGLFCVNHPFSGSLGWRAYDFDWSRADLLEVYHNLEGPNNNYHTGLWDHHLRVGRRIVGVGGTDSHHPEQGVHALGQLVTWVRADELSERGILQGLRRGDVFVSRNPEIRFTAVAASGDTATMGGSVTRAMGSITFTVQVKAAHPLRLFILRDGYPFDMLPVEPSEGTWQTITFEDAPRRPAYYRLELHRVRRSRVYRFVQWRDWATLQALSNPIWVTPS
jgi:hypothetical protein